MQKMQKDFQRANTLKVLKNPMMVAHTGASAAAVLTM